MLFIPLFGGTDHYFDLNIFNLEFYIIPFSKSLDLFWSMMNSEIIQGASHSLQEHCLLWVLDLAIIIVIVMMMMMMITTVMYMVTDRKCQVKSIYYRALYLSSGWILSKSQTGVLCLNNQVIFLNVW